MSKVQISRILHAGYIFENAGVRLAFDPIFESPFSQNCYAFPRVTFDLEALRKEKFDAVFISHYHDDHCSFESLDYLDRATPIYMYCIFEEMFDLLRELGFKTVHSLALDAPIDIGPFTITPLRALDEDVDSIFHIQCAGLNLLNVVDSWIPPDTLKQLEEIAPWDLVLWPFQTMRELEVISPGTALSLEGELPEEWTQQLRALQPRYVVASSCQFKFEPWSWYNDVFFPISYARFAQEIEHQIPATQVLRLDPGEAIALDVGTLSVVQPLSWIERLDDKSVDYAFRKDVKPPPTAEIAKRLSALNQREMERVQAFLQDEISAKHNVLGASDESYWIKNRQWRLTTYDHNGASAVYDFELDGDFMRSKVVSDNFLPDWETELPLAKLYAALELGESLTSMYVRIKNKAPEADLVSDPLLRVMFQRQFGAYQKAQLQRLKR